MAYRVNIIVKFLSCLRNWCWSVNSNCPKKWKTRSRLEWNVSGKLPSLKCMVCPKPCSPCRTHSLLIKWSPLKMNNLLTPKNIKNKSNQNIFYKTNRIKRHQGELSFGGLHSEMSTAALEVRPTSLNNLLLLYGYHLGQNEWNIWTTSPSNFNDAKMGRFPSFAPSSLGSFSKPPRRRQRERHQTKGLMSRTIAVHVRFETLYISLPCSAKQQREMTKFYVFWRTPTAMAKFWYLL